MSKESQIRESSQKFKNLNKEDINNNFLPNVNQSGSPQTKRKQQLANMSKHIQGNHSIMNEMKDRDQLPPEFSNK